MITTDIFRAIRKGISEFAPCLFLFCVPLLLCLWHLTRVVSSVMWSDDLMKVQQVVFVERKVSSVLPVPAMSISGIWEGFIKGLCGFLCVLLFLHTASCWHEEDALSYEGESCRANSTSICPLIVDVVNSVPSFISNFFESKDVLPRCIISSVAYGLLLGAVFLTSEVSTLVFFPFPSLRWPVPPTHRFWSIVCGDMLCTLFIITLMICVGVATKNFAVGFMLAIVYGPVLVLASLVALSEVRSIELSLFKNKRATSAIMAICSLLVSPIVASVAAAGIAVASSAHHMEMNRSPLVLGEWQVYFAHAMINTQLTSVYHHSDWKSFWTGSSYCVKFDKVSGAHVGSLLYLTIPLFLQHVVPPNRIYSAYTMMVRVLWRHCVMMPRYRSGQANIRKIIFLHNICMCVMPT